MKWQKYGPDVIPMWVADMDFATSRVVTDALAQRIEHPIFGYTVPPDSLFDAAAQYCQTHHAWQIERDSIVWLPGMLSALVAACDVVGPAGNEIIVFPPVYYPLLDIPIKVGKKRIDVPMQLKDNTWHIDFEILEASINKNTSAILISSPHNPMGVMFSANDLTRLVELCHANNIYLISDEIHCDLILHRKKKHINASVAAGDLHKSVITMMSPGKTFNLAGSNCAFVSITDDTLRKKFTDKCLYQIPHPPVLSYTAAEAVYRHGWDWHKELIAYLRANHDYLLEEINNLPGLSMNPLDATYLAWIDTSELQVANAHELFLTAGVGLSPGTQFADGNYQRLNFACSRTQLSNALQRMSEAIAKI